MGGEKDWEGNGYGFWGMRVKKFVGDLVKEEVENYVEKDGDVGEVVVEKIEE